MKKIYTFHYCFIFFISFLVQINITAQTVVDNPCTYNAANQIKDGDCGILVSTANFTNLYDITDCSNGATLINDGWFWYDGTGLAGNTITFTPDPGFDAVVQIMEGTDLNPCAGFFAGECADNTGIGGIESVTGGGTIGVRYLVIIEQVGSNTPMSGTICMTENLATCNDKIHNQGESGIDCGGPCPCQNCPPSTSISQFSSNDTPCGLTVNSTLDTVTCNTVGSPCFNATSGLVNINAPGNIDAPNPSPSCGGIPGNGRTEGTWVVYDPINGVTSASLNINPDDASGSQDIFVAFYQGSSCNSLTELGCQTLLRRQGVSFQLLPINILGIDETKMLYMFVYSTQAFSIQNVQLQGFQAVATNDDCANAAIASQGGCNVGARPAATSSVLPPSSAGLGQVCQGGSWLSNENTVFYSFTPTQTSATLEISNIVCNDGQQGLAQFGVWTSCAAMSQLPLASNGFLGCVVGTDPLTLSGLTIGQTYFIAVDGNAGDWCAWDFEATGGIILLYNELNNFNAISKQEYVELSWNTSTAHDLQQFIVQKSTDGIDFFNCTSTITESVANYFNTKDEHPFNNTTYYRLKIRDISGTMSYSQIIAVDRNQYTNKGKIHLHNIFPKPAVEFINLDLEIGSSEKIHLSLVNQLGQQIYFKIIEVYPNSINKIRLNFETIDAGLYSLIIEEPISQLTLLEKIQVSN